MTALGVGVGWLVLWVLTRRAVVRRVSAGRWSPERGAPIVGLTWGLLPAGFYLAAPPGTPILVAVFASAVCFATAWLASMFALRRLATRD